MGGPALRLTFGDQFDPDMGAPATTKERADEFIKAIFGAAQPGIPAGHTDYGEQYIQSLSANGWQSLVLLEYMSSSSCAGYIEVPNYRLLAEYDRGVGTPDLNNAPYGTLGGCRNCPDHSFAADCSTVDTALAACEQLCDSDPANCVGIYFYHEAQGGAPAGRCCPLAEMPAFPGEDNYAYGTHVAFYERLYLEESFFFAATISGRFEPYLIWALTSSQRSGDVSFSWGFSFP